MVGCDTGNLRGGTVAQVTAGVRCCLGDSFLKHLSHPVLVEPSFEDLPISSLLFPPVIMAAEVQTLVLVLLGYCSGLPLLLYSTWPPELVSFLSHKTDNTLLHKDT